MENKSSYYERHISENDMRAHLTKEPFRDIREREFESYSLSPYTYNHHHTTPHNTHKKHKKHTIHLGSCRQANSQLHRQSFIVTTSRQQYGLKRFRAAPYSATDEPETLAIDTFRFLVDHKKVKLDIKERDKYPNIDGYIEL